MEISGNPVGRVKDQKRSGVKEIKLENNKMKQQNERVDI